MKDVMKGVFLLPYANSLRVINTRFLTFFSLIFIYSIPLNRILSIKSIVSVTPKWRTVSYVFPMHILNNEKTNGTVE